MILPGVVPMARLGVVEIGDVVLSQKARPIEKITESHRRLADDLVDTMYGTPGSVGIAAPQVGVPEALFVIDVSGHKKTNVCHGLLILCNPAVVSASKPLTLREGCMSVPHLTGDVKRASRVTVTGMDMSGETRLIVTDAFEARALLHEIDHLNGKLFLDRVAGPHAIFRRKKYL